MIWTKGNTVEFRFFQPSIGKLNLVRKIGGKNLTEGNPRETTFGSIDREF